jgi:protein involved in polysaccharide export with SLBB domain
MQAGGLLPNHEPGKLLLFRGDTRERKVEHLDIQVTLGLEKTDENYPLEAKDLIQIPIDPRWYDKEVVSLGGLFVRPGKYALLFPGERLSSVIKRAGGFKNDAYIQGGRYFRDRDSVGRVGVDVEAALRHTGRRADIPMVGGDSLYIPEVATTVKVIGEVGFETSVLFKEGASADYYIERAGGFTRRSEADKVVIQYANGESSRNGAFTRKPDAGSVIYVPQGPEPKPIDWLSGTNLILGTITTSVTLLILINQL